MSVTKEEVMRLKGLGFLRNRDTDCFSGRVVVAGGVYTAEDLKHIATCAELFGSGKVCFTSRLAAEIVGIPADKVDGAIAYLAERGLAFGGTGARVRPVTACKGTTCTFGIMDTQALALALHERFYLGMHDVALPHKLKLGVGGCPNSCMKPSLNDIGIEARFLHNEETNKIDRVWRVSVGGTWGKTRRDGTLLSFPVYPEKILDTVEAILLWFRENAYRTERLGKAIDRLGIATLEAGILDGSLLARREEILAAPIKERPAEG